MPASAVAGTIEGASALPREDLSTLSFRGPRRVVWDGREDRGCSSASLHQEFA
jgi:hypothetical protein